MRVRSDGTTSLGKVGGAPLGTMLVVAVGALVGLAPTWGCESGPTETATGSSTSTVTLGAQRVLLIDSLVPVTVIGERRTSHLIVRLDLTITASSAELAERTLAAYAPTVDPDGIPGTLSIGFLAPAAGLIGGRATIQAPLDLDLRVLARAGEVDVQAMEGAIQIDSVTSVRVTDAEDDVVLRVESGNAIVDTRLRAGNRVDIGVGAGDVQVDLPTPLDANVDAESTAGVVSSHPDLPSRPASIPYRFTAGSGVASVVATTRRGTVVFNPRRRN